MQSQTSTGAVHRMRLVGNLLTVGVVCLLVLGGLWIISQNAPSARQQENVSLEVPVISGADGCQNFADYWMNTSGVDVSAEVISTLSNCRQDSSGAWFRPTGSSDPRLTDSDRLTLEEAAAVAPLADQINNSLSGLSDTIPRSLQEALKANYDPRNQPVFGHTRKGAPAIGDKRTRYIRIASAFLLDPDNAALADYVAWATARKQTAADEFLAACHASPDLQFLWRACGGVPGEFQVGYLPLLWDLQDPVLLQDYLIYRARSGEPLPISATPASPN